MSGNKQNLQRIITVYGQRLEEARRAVEQVKDLLAKADARRIAEPQNQRKWNAVLDNLELSLDDAKARQEACTVEFQRATLTLQALEANAPAPLEAPGADVFPAAAGLDTSESPEESLLEAPLEHLAQFSLEQIAIVQSHLMDLSPEEHPEAEQLLGRLELANQIREDPPAPENTGTPFENQRRQLLLRAAIDKIQTNRLDTMTADEVRLVISCHSLLTRRLRLTPRDERLIRILGAAIKVLQRKNAEFRKSSTG